MPQLAVPLEFIINAQKLLPPRGKQYQYTALLIGVAYLYLLRVGEYTKPRRQTRTVQFRLKDVLFWSNNIAMDPRTTPISALLTTDAATLRIENQKNGVKDQTIYHKKSKNNSEICLVNLLLKLTIELLKDNASGDTMLCAYKLNNTWYHLENRHITLLVKLIARKINMHSKGFPINCIGSHSLKAEGAMTLKLNGINTVLIKKYGHWTSDTFITYIHEQIAHLAAGVSTAMTTNLAFHNVAGFAD